MKDSYDVLVVGSYSIDMVFTGLPRFPVMGEDTIGTGFDMLPGEAYTSAIAMHRLGLKVGWAADFGNDAFSRMALEAARAEGLDEALFVHHSRPLRRVSAAASYPEDRAFITYYDPDPVPPAGLKALASASSRSLYVPGLFYGPSFDLALPLVRLKKMKVIMDGNSDQNARLENPAVKRALKSVDVFLPNLKEAIQISGENNLEDAIRSLAAFTSLVVIKDGANGAYACQGSQIQHVPAIPVTPVDTTGAGDCFSAGFTAAYLSGRSIRECLQWANIVGGLSTLKWGGTGQKVTCEQVETWLTRQYSDRLPPDDSNL